MLAVVVVLLLGSRLHIAGYPTIPLPWKYLDQWLLRDVIPLRLAVYLFLIVAVIAAMWLAKPAAGRWALGKWAVAALSIAFLVPNIGAGLWRSQQPNPAFFTTHEYRSVLTRGETVLVLPWGQLGNSMLWQAETGHLVPHGRWIPQSEGTRRITSRTLCSPPCSGTPGRIHRRCGLFSPVGMWAQ